MAPPVSKDNEQYDAFISYSRKDSEFADKSVKALENFSPPKGLNLPQHYLRIFLDRSDMTGTDYDKAIQDKIEKSANYFSRPAQSFGRKSKFKATDITRNFAR